MQFMQKFGLAKYAKAWLSHGVVAIEVEIDNTKNNPVDITYINNLRQSIVPKSTGAQILIDDLKQMLSKTDASELPPVNLRWRFCPTTGTQFQAKANGITFHESSYQ